MTSKPTSLTSRVALSFALLALLLLAGSGFYHYQALTSEMERSDGEELAGKTALFQKTLSYGLDTASLARTPAILTHYLVGHDNLALRVRDSAGRLLLDNQAPLPAAQAVPHLPAPQPLEGIGGDGQPWRGLSSGVTLADGQRVQLEVWRNVHGHAALLTWYRNRLLGAGALAALLAGGLGWLLVRASLAPLRGLTASAQAIRSDTLSQRLDSGSAPAELQGLVDSFNGVLARLDTAFERLSAYASDLAHEMRTPLGILLGQTQVALSRERSADAYRQTLADNAEELERLARMVNDLLFLAKADNADTLLQREPLALEIEAQQVCDFLELLAEEKGIRLEVSGQLTLHADRSALRRLLNNLVSNAIRYSPAGETVRLLIDPSLPGLVVDNRPASALPGELNLMFERFYSQGEKGDGHGLGLPIARAIAELHGGTLSAELAHGRLHMTARLAAPSSQNAR